MRYLLLVLLLAGRVMGAGDFSFDVTSNADNNWVKIPTNAAHRLSTVHSVASWMKPGVDGVIETVVVRKTGGVSDANYNLRDETAGDFRAVASTGSVAGASYDARGGTATAGTQEHFAVAFASASSAILYINGVSTATDSTVAAGDDPAVGVTVGCADNGSTTCTASVDHRGSSDRLLIYAVKLGAPEMAMLGCRNCLQERRLSRQPVLRMSMMGVPGANMGSNVPDHSNTKAHGDGSAGTDPTYTESFLRGHR